jgi:hypothetical protein
MGHCWWILAVWSDQILRFVDSHTRLLRFVFTNLKCGIWRSESSITNVPMLESMRPEY